MQRRLKFQKFELLQSGSLFAQDAAIIHLAGNIEISDDKNSQEEVIFFTNTYILSRNIEVWAIRILKKLYSFQNKEYYKKILKYAAVRIHNKKLFVCDKNSQKPKKEITRRRCSFVKVDATSSADVK